MFTIGTKMSKVEVFITKHMDQIRSLTREQIDELLIENSLNEFTDEFWSIYEGWFGIPRNQVNECIQRGVRYAARA